MGCNLIKSLVSSRFCISRPIVPINEFVVDQKQENKTLITKSREQCKRYAYNATKLTKKLNIQLMMNPPWRTQLENAFSWMGGWRPSTILRLLDAALKRGLVTDETKGSHQNVYNTYFENVLKECQSIEEEMEARLQYCQINPNSYPAPSQCLFLPQPREGVEEWKDFPTVLALLDGSFDKRDAAIKALERKISGVHTIAEDAFDLRFQVSNAIDKIPATYQHQISEFVRLLCAVEKGFRCKGMHLLCPKNNHLWEGERNSTTDLGRLANLVQDEQNLRCSNQQTECKRKAKAEEEVRKGKSKAEEEERGRKAKADKDQQLVTPDDNNLMSNNNNMTATMNPADNSNLRGNNNNSLTTSINIPGFVNAIAGIPIVPMHTSINLQMPNTNNFVFPSSSVAAVNAGAADATVYHVHK